MGDIYGFITQTPPGQIKDVEKDIRTLLDNDASDSKITEGLSDYHVSQFTAVNVEGVQHQVVLSPYNRLDKDKFVDYVTGKQFDVDFKTLTTSNAENTEKHEDLLDLWEQLKTYVGEHYPSNAYCGIAPDGEDKRLYIVGSKYSPQNFWSGRWRSNFKVTGSAVEGDIDVDAHFYEDGNVRLLTSHHCEGEGTDAIKLVHGLESDFEKQLNAAFVDLADGAFKRLRRQLPVTRQRIDWDKVHSLRLGQDISGSRR